jgi:transposase
MGRRMSESVGHRFAMGVGTMPKAYSEDLRGRVVSRVEGGASRREAAEHFEIAASSAIKWMQLFETTGSYAAKPRGGSTSPLEKHADWLLGIIAECPDLTLDEVVAAMRKRGLAGSRTAVWRFFDRRKITFKKKPQGSRARSTRRGSGTSALEARPRHA